MKRKDFLKLSSASALLFGLKSNAVNLYDSSEYYDYKKNNSQYMGDFSAPKLDVVRVAFIGVGARGSGHAKQIAAIEGTEVVGISDLYKDLAEKSSIICQEIGNGKRHKNIAIYSGNKNKWIAMLDEVKPDAVFISTNWDNHAPMAIQTMKSGAHAFVEVPMATTIEDLWDIVNTSEKTRRHCMMMENVNYGRDELMYLNMCRKGVIGDFLHAEAAYIHELRFQMKEEERGTGSWRTHHYAKSKGNLYPTHGLGPVAQYMNLARGEDNFNSLVSYSTPSLGRKLYAEKNYESGHKWNKLNYSNGDMNTSIIKTNLGRTIMIQWDETSPRPYTRHNLIQGTKGILAGFPTRVALENGVEGITKDHHTWVQGQNLKILYEKYDHPINKRLDSLIQKMGGRNHVGHGGMDFVMRYRIIECLRNGEPLDQNVYEGCFWSAVTPLSANSINSGGAPQKFPDFTRGNWNKTKPLKIIS
tara:strand:- start:415 stop:1830 length:1416 start_codon:yes stop_codon:yes gene_type:complete